MGLGDIAAALPAVKKLGDEFEGMRRILEAQLAEQRKHTELLREQNEWLKQLSSALARRAA